MLAKTADGFRIAEEDLKLRGPGDFFGQRQHGLPQLGIADLAADMRVLKEPSRPPRSCWRPIPAYPGGSTHRCWAGCAACLPSTVTCSTERPARGRRIT